MRHNRHKSPDGRRYYTQRSDLPANQEDRQRRAGNVFAIRRPVVEPSDSLFQEARHSELVKDYIKLEFGERYGNRRDAQGVFDAVIDERKFLSVTLMSKRRMNKGIKRGLEAGFNMNSAVRKKVERNVPDEAGDEIKVPIIDYRWIGQGMRQFVAILKQDGQLANEREIIVETLEDSGIKGLRRPENEDPLHATLLYSNRPMSEEQRDEFKETFKDSLRMARKDALEDLRRANPEMTDEESLDIIDPTVMSLGRLAIRT